MGDMSFRDCSTNNNSLAKQVCDSNNGGVISGYSF